MPIPRKGDKKIRSRRLEEKADKHAARAKQSEEWENDEEPEEDKPSTVILEGIKKVGTPRKRSGKEIKRTGLPLGIKFALAISIVSAGLCFFSQLFVYFRVEDSLLLEIDRKGTSMVRIVVSLADEYYKLYKETQEDEESAKKQQGDDVAQQEARYEMRKRAVNRRNELKDRFTRYLDRVVSYSMDKEKVSSEQILTVALVSESIPSLQAGRQAETQENLKISGSETQIYERIGDYWYGTPIKVLKGTMSTGRRLFGVRAYRLSNQEKIGAMVMLSERDITRTLDGIFTSILITAFIAIVIGIGLSFLLASHVTKPLRHLMEDIEIVAEGDLEHTTKACSKDEIGVLANSFNVMTQNLAVAHKSELDRQAREYEMKVATNIQANLLPSQVPKIKGYDIGRFYQPAKEVGGDYYDFIEIDADHLGFIVADVSGKSIPGSMIMTMARALIRMESLRTISPAQMFIAVNRILAQDIQKGMFVTAMYLVLGISKGELIISSAGHNPAVIWRNKTKQVELANPKGMALGLDRGSIFEKTIREEKLSFNPGDRVVLYTDGVPEAMSPDNEEFSEKRFFDLVAGEGLQTSEHLIKTVVSSLADWRKDTYQSDDITIVTCKRV